MKDKKAKQGDHGFVSYEPLPNTQDYLFDLRCMSRHYIWETSQQHQQEPRLFAGPVNPHCLSSLLSLLNFAAIPCGEKVKK